MYPPCIASYTVDILCVYKVGFRSPLYTPAMGDKAVFCAKNMPLDLARWLYTTLVFSLYPASFPQRNDSIYAAMHFINRWFPSKNGHNMSHHPLHRNMFPQWFRAKIFCWALYMAKHFIEEILPFKKITFAAAMAFYRKTVAAKHFTYRTIYSHILSYMSSTVLDFIAHGRRRMVLYIII